MERTLIKGKIMAKQARRWHLQQKHAVGGDEEEKERKRRAKKKIRRKGRRARSTWRRGLAQ
jgi:hypothetical protein